MFLVALSTVKGFGTVSARQGKVVPYTSGSYFVDGIDYIVSGVRLNRRKAGSGCKSVGTELDYRGGCLLFHIT